ncbi:MAG: BspA family leucine-rich repeat surface protein [Balneolaceae bacterium]
MIKNDFKFIVACSYLLIVAGCSEDPPTSSDNGSDGISSRYQLYVDVTPSGGGTVTPSEGNFDSSEVVELVATPEEGFRFVEWLGDGSGSTNPLSVTMDEDQTITALFEKREYPLSISVEGEGTVYEKVVQSLNETSYDHGTTVELTATAADDWVFSHWSGDLSESENPQRVTVDKEKTVTAVFEKAESYELEVSSSDGGSVDSEFVEGKRSGDSFIHGSKVEFRANPEEGYRFVGWSGDLSGNENPVTISMDENKSISASFEIRNYPLTIETTGEGSVQEKVVQSLNENSYEHGTTVELTASASEGWVFSHWSGALSGGENPQRLTVDEEKEVTAVFEEAVLYDVSLVEEGEGEVSIELISGRKSGSKYEEGSVLELSAIPIEGNSFVEWYGFLSSEESKVQFEVTEKVELTAVFRSLFYLHENGVTIRCEDAEAGETGIVDGVEYTAVDWRMLDEAVEGNEDVTVLCTSSVQRMSSMFNQNRYFNQDISSWDTSNVTSMSFMFSGAEFFEGDISEWDISSVTDMSYMFNGSANFNTDISNWDVSGVTDMTSMFSGASNFNQDISKWETGSLEKLSAIFRNAENFNQPIGSWDVSGVSNFNSAFRGAVAFNQALNEWDVSKAISMNEMFYGATNFNQELNGWNVSNVQDMRQMFQSASNFDGAISSWDISSVIEMESMFSGAKNFNQPIGNWDLGNVRTINGVFAGAENFNQDIGGWDVSNLESLRSLFLNASLFNKDISDWSVGQVTDMRSMFSGAESFNQSLEEWNTSHVESMETMFRGASSFNQNISSWDVSKVEDMSWMFREASSFDQPLESWDVSSVKSMAYMFGQAKSFNQPLNNWNVSSVTDFGSMFSGATIYNQPLEEWDVSSAIIMDWMFHNAGSFDQDLSGWCVQNIIEQPHGFSSSSMSTEQLPVWGTCPSE